VKKKESEKIIAQGKKSAKKAKILFLIVTAEAGPRR
jgi:hypothetical protein